MGSTLEEHGMRARVRKWAPAAAVALALCGLITFGWVGVGTRAALQQSVQQALQVTELRGTIALLDELLTMSARIAALSGDQRWIARYNEAEPRLDAAITEAVALATPEVAAELARTTDKANRRLVEMERASFMHVVAGQHAEAWRLLDGQEYEGLKAVYTQGIQAFGRELESFAAARTANLNEQAWLETFGLVLGGSVFLIAAALAIRGYARLRIALRYTEAAVRHDVLTGLANRLKLREHMEAVLGQRRRSGHGLAVFYLDLDGFKAVNDLLGHATGDELLRLAAARILTCVRDGDLVARLGGDEFAIVQAGALQARDVAVLAERLIATMQEPFAVQGQAVSVSVSVGAVLAEGTATPEDLLRDADIALYRAKAEGRCTWRLFTHEMGAAILAQRTLEADLRKALAAGQFEVLYQPLVDARTKALVGFEALLRWHHPVQGTVPPAEFIPAAEQLGLMRPIGVWVLEQACRAASTWPDGLSVAVNLSPGQLLQGDVVRDVEHALAGSGLRAGRLELEITEAVLLQNGALAALHRLRALGVRIAMDDFGTGSSSLNSLRQFPFDKLKIDRAFVRDIGREGGHVEMIRAMVSLGRALDIKVLAKGVETTEQLRLLQAEHCTELQGYLFGRPGSLEATNLLLAREDLQGSLAKAG